MTHMDDKTNLTPEQDEVQTGEEVSFTISGEDAAAQEALNAKKLPEYIRRRAKEVPVLGICLGMQCLMRRSFEDGEHAGLGFCDGDVIRFGNTNLEAIHVPGHSPGSLVFYCRAANCLFSGDALFKGSIGRTDLEGGDFETLREHICSNLFSLPAETVVYPGHGEPTSIGAEKMTNPFFR